MFADLCVYSIVACNKWDGKIRHRVVTITRICKNKNKKQKKKQKASKICFSKNQTVGLFFFFFCISWLWSQIYAWFYHLTYYKPQLSKHIGRQTTSSSHSLLLFESCGPKHLGWIGLYCHCPWDGVMLKYPSGGGGRAFVSMCRRGTFLILL